MGRREKELPVPYPSTWLCGIHIPSEHREHLFLRMPNVLYHRRVLSLMATRASGLAQMYYEAITHDQAWEDVWEVYESEVRSAYCGKKGSELEQNR